MFTFQIDSSGVQNKGYAVIKTGEDCAELVVVAGPEPSGSFIEPSGSRFTSAFFDPCNC